MISVSPAHGADTENETRIDLTPMIDVIFTVIAFMMIIINVPLQTLDFDLPNTDENAASIRTDPVILYVNDEASSWRVGQGQSGNADETLAALNALKSGNDGPLPIVILIREDAPVQRIVETFSMLQEGRFEQVSIATEGLDASDVAPDQAFESRPRQ